MNETAVREDLEGIFRAALRRVDARDMVMSHCSVTDGIFTVATEDHQSSVSLSDFDSVYVLGVGKAALPMARALEELLEGHLSGGIVVTKGPLVTAPRGAGRSDGPQEPEQLEVLEAGHPVPDERSVAAAERVLELCAQGDERTLFINVISGGGSALLAGPVHAQAPAEADHRPGVVGITLEEMQAATGALLESGASIDVINTIRKHLSRVKAGRLAEAMQPARSVNLILSDVVGDRLDTIASGLTVPDTTRFADALRYVEQFALEERIPESVTARLRSGARGEVPETPKPGSAAFAGVENILLGTNYHGLRAAMDEARRRGYGVLPLTSQLVGEAREAAGFLAGIAADVAGRALAGEPPLCMLAGGETTVTIRGAGTGGRNQELSLAFLSRMAARPDAFSRVALLSASTDGNDGPTDAAGAFALPSLVEAAKADGLDPESYLAENDAYRFFDALGALLRTGPTGTNVCDYQIILVTE
jgi:hydroxypyruvate reductase